MTMEEATEEARRIYYSQDKVRIGRVTSSGILPRVPRSFVTKLDWDKVAIIRTSNDTPEGLAERFGVSKTLISKVRSHKAWKGTPHS